MAAISQVSGSLIKQQLRPLNPRRDLGQVADLVELCFADTLDIDGKRYLQRMRQAAQGHNRWLDINTYQINITAEGFVWDEDGQIVGNISLIPFASLGRPIYLIANVAVHPDFRRQGIARALTQAALNWIQKRPTYAIWLQVRASNLPAVKLYESIEFIERARRTTWVAQPGDLGGEAPSGVRIVPHKSRYWKHQREWLQLNYPDELFWYWPIRPATFRPSILGALVRFFSDVRLKHWGVEKHGQLLGLLSWIATTTYADQLWLATPPENEDIVLNTLLPHIHWQERTQRPLSIDYPTGRAAKTLHDIGFRPDHTLIWMEKKS